MPHRLDDFLELTQAVTDTDALNTAFRDAVLAEGYENITFVRSGRNGLTNVFYTEMPVGFVADYAHNNWQFVDPVLRKSRLARQPFAWESMFDTRDLTPEEVRFFAESRDRGVHDGVTMPFHDPYGGTHVFGVSIRDNPRPDPGRLAYIYALAAQTWIRHCSLDGADAPSDRVKINLTSRERECLRWAKQGKTNWEISQIISVAERTVEFHIGNAMRKLKATNRVTAIVIAIQEGLIGI